MSSTNTKWKTISSNALEEYSDQTKQGKIARSKRLFKQTDKVHRMKIHKPKVEYSN